MVPVPSRFVTVALVSSERWTVKVSSGSTVVSPLTLTVMVCVSVVLLAGKVSVPDFAV